MTLAIAILGAVCLISIYINVALLNRLLIQASISSLRPVPVHKTSDPEEEKTPRRPIFSVPVRD